MGRESVDALAPMAACAEHIAGGFGKARGDVVFGAPDVEPPMRAVFAFFVCGWNGGGESDPSFGQEALVFPQAVVEVEVAELGQLAGRCVEIRGTDDVVGAVALPSDVFHADAIEEMGPHPCVHVLAFKGGAQDGDGEIAGAAGIVPMGAGLEAHGLLGGKGSHIFAAFAVEHGQDRRIEERGFVAFAPKEAGGHLEEMADRDGFVLSAIQGLVEGGGGLIERKQSLLLGDTVEGVDEAFADRPSEMGAIFVKATSVFFKREIAAFDDHQAVGTDAFAILVVACTGKGVLIECCEGFGVDAEVFGLFGLPLLGRPVGAVAYDGRIGGDGLAQGLEADGEGVGFGLFTGDEPRKAKQAKKGCKVRGQGEGSGFEGGIGSVDAEESEESACGEEEASKLKESRKQGAKGVTGGACVLEGDVEHGLKPKAKGPKADSKKTIAPLCAEGVVVFLGVWLAQGDQECGLEPKGGSSEPEELSSDDPCGAWVVARDTKHREDRAFKGQEQESSDPRLEKVSPRMIFVKPSRSPVDAERPRRELERLVFIELKGLEMLHLLGMFEVCGVFLWMLGPRPEMEGDHEDRGGKDKRSADQEADAQSAARKERSRKGHRQEVSPKSDLQSAGFCGGDLKARSRQEQSEDRKQKPQTKEEIEESTRKDIGSQRERTEAKQAERKRPHPRTKQPKADGVLEP